MKYKRKEIREIEREHGRFLKQQVKSIDEIKADKEHRDILAEDYTEVIGELCSKIDKEYVLQLLKVDAGQGVGHKYLNEQQRELCKTNIERTIKSLKGIYNLIDADTEKGESWTVRQ